jgi:hypothetical protein
MKKCAAFIIFIFFLTGLSVFDARGASSITNIDCPKGKLDSYEIKPNGDATFIFKSTCHLGDWSEQIDITTTAEWVGLFALKSAAKESITASNGMTGGTMSECPASLFDNPWLFDSAQCNKIYANGNVFTDSTWRLPGKEGWILLLPTSKLPLSRDILDPALKQKIINELLAKFKVPVAQAEPATNITRDFATLNGVVGTYGIGTTIEVYLGTQPSGSSDPKNASWKLVKSFVTDWNNMNEAHVHADVALQPGIKYQHKIKAINPIGTVESNVLSFITPAPPIAETKPAINVKATSASLTGRVNPNNPSEVARYVFRYGTTSACGSTSPVQTIGSGTNWIDVHFTLSDLKRNTTYHYYIEALNNTGNSKGTEVTFITPGTVPPTVVTGAATNITQVMATLNGTINPNTATEAVKWYFDFGTTTGYGTVFPASVPGNVGSGTTNTTVSQPAYGLKPGTTYHYRLVGITSLGTSFGKDMVFTTSK